MQAKRDEDHLGASKIIRGSDYMKYEEIVHGRLNKRINRFIAEVFIDGIKEQVHVKNTGRLTELLRSGTDVLLERSGNPNRKTRFSLIAAAKNGSWVNIDSQAPNRVVFEALKEGKITELGTVNLVKREVTFGASRFDLYFEQDGIKGFIEVKGVTLEKDGIALFPDAPTSRGTKHVVEMANAVLEGCTGVILFVVQMKGCHAFVPHREMDAPFADALLEASRQGVQILAYDSIVTEDELVLDKALPVYLS
ncbi:sugar fermentation stimulation protein A [Virgibacillus natechei]|uniref:Sugar fermentation stimulation protein homolog n=1 Tax=Virgibacillus natechei TaxID=1216297 RepID=A0ABS4ILE3_9BACI|nr:DNA/RNA nuclease SfsA [Virgibacillus natechei]MBP1971779.1 sugar fermentation stimulation protein A [Virgibacillus natechei]UZD12891.1 DNA/RNA nuclease SfsA [Virgibacillus natechei]